MTYPQNPAGESPDAAVPPAAPQAYAPPAYPGAPEAAAPYAAAPPAPYGPPAGQVVPGKTLGIVALVVVFFFSLVGLILGYVARSQSKKAGASNTPALVAIILGWIFLVLSIVIGIIIAVTFATTLSAYSELCSELGSGVWELTDGTTFTCP